MGKRKKAKKYIYRDARDGKFVKKKFADKNPDITVRELIK